MYYIRYSRVFIITKLYRITVSRFKTSCQNNGNKARQDKTRQGKTRQDKTRQDTYNTLQYLQSFIILFPQAAFVLHE